MNVVLCDPSLTRTLIECGPRPLKMNTNHVPKNESTGSRSIHTVHPSNLLSHSITAMRGFPSKSHMRNWSEGNFSHKNIASQ